MSKFAPTTGLPLLTLNSNPRLGRIRVGFEAYFEFNFGLTEDIDDFIRVHCWKHGLGPVDERRLQDRPLDNDANRPR